MHVFFHKRTPFLDIFGGLFGICAFDIWRYAGFLVGHIILNMFSLIIIPGSYMSFLLDSDAKAERQT